MKAVIKPHKHMKTQCLPEYGYSHMQNKRETKQQQLKQSLRSSATADSWCPCGVTKHLLCANNTVLLRKRNAFPLFCHLQKTCTLELHQSFGQDFRTVAACQMVFRDIFDKPSGRIHGLATLTGEKGFMLVVIQESAGALGREVR